LTIQARGAEHRDFPAIREIISQAFRHGPADEAPLWDYLVESDPSVQPECARVALQGARITAISLVVPRQIQTPRGPVPGAAITVVACDPAFQGQGYGGAAVRDSLRFMAEQGMAVAMLYGIRGYYPRFGFAPVLPHWDTTLILEDLPAGEPLAAASALDLPALTELFAATAGRYPGAELRDASPWFWKLRNPGAHALLKLPACRGYAFAGLNKKEESIDVLEAAAIDGAAARELLAGLKEHCLGQGVAKLRLFLPPDHLLARLGFLLGGRQRTIPAGPGMAAITRWDRILPDEGYSVMDEGLTLAGHLVLRATRFHLTQLAMGYRSLDDLLLLPEVALTDQSRSVRARLDADFPAGYPRWSLAPFWYNL
jgi:putative acetyltransferase